MWNAVRYALIGFALVGSCVGSQASETYCQGEGGRIYDGGTFTINNTTVIGSARKPQLPGQEKATTGCSYNWNSLGGFYRPIEVIKQPKLGAVSVPRKYLIFYKPTKTGNDEFVVRIQPLLKTEWVRALPR